jgi:hypothetical protein
MQVTREGLVLHAASAQQFSADTGRAHAANYPSALLIRGGAAVRSVAPAHRWMYPTWRGSP